MKILHTADWHIGKTLYKQSLREELNLFFEWMLDLIDRESVDVILVSGDIFDLANPANADKKLFYQTLSKLKDRNVQCIITAGNHDSPSLIEAPVELLKALNIHTIGYGYKLTEQLITISDIDGNEVAHILAVPFLREGDLRKSQPGASYEDKIVGLREGIINHYQMLKGMAEEANSSIPVIAMGHLYVQGAHLSDSERDIHIGNLAGLSVEQFSNLFDYVALGHIHRPQKLNKEGTIRYSGSPIPLSFSERKDEKEVVLFDISDGHIINTKAMPVPVFKALKRVEGSLVEVRHQLDSYRSNNQLPTLIEIVVREKVQDYSKVLELIELAQHASPHYDVINYRIQFEEQIQPLSEAGLLEQIEDLNVKDVFFKRLESESLEEKMREEVIEAFDEVVRNVMEEK